MISTNDAITLTFAFDFEVDNAGTVVRDVDFARPIGFVPLFKTDWLRALAPEWVPEYEVVEMAVREIITFADELGQPLGDAECLVLYSTDRHFLASKGVVLSLDAALALNSIVGRWIAERLEGFHRGLLTAGYGPDTDWSRR